MDEDEEITKLDDAMWDPAECLVMLGQGCETDLEGSILPNISVHTVNGLHDFRTLMITISVEGRAVMC